MSDYPKDNRPILCLDFDGVIHSYDKGWMNGAIYGCVTEGFWDWVDKAKGYFRLVVYSSRSKDHAMRGAMEAWMRFQHKTDRPKEPFPEFEFAHEKPPAFLTIDDRGLTFTGNWADFDPEKLRSFQPWMGNAFRT